MKLEKIGFYTLEDNRARNVSEISPLWRCELLLTSRCNFNCTYCRKRSIPDIDIQRAKDIVDYWDSEGLRNIRFSGGGGPTIYKNLVDLIYHTTHKESIQRIAISTNGSAEKNFYQELIDLGVNDFSISMDSCCAAIGDSIAGKKGSWKHVIEMIEFIAHQTYTTVGIVIFNKNEKELRNIINLAIDLGVDDIRIISAAQWNQKLTLSMENQKKYPILAYRLNNLNEGRNVRGITEKDNPQCPLVLDDMAIERDYHYPCIIYLRERGNPIGKIGMNWSHIRKDRTNWFENHNCFEDPICRENCLDVCIDYNNRVRYLQDYSTRMKNDS